MKQSAVVLLLLGAASGYLMTRPGASLRAQQTAPAVQAAPFRAPTWTDVPLTPTQYTAGHRTGRSRT